MQHHQRRWHLSGTDWGHAVRTQGLIAGVSVLTIGAAIAAGLFLPRTYTATAEIYIEYRGSDPILGRQFSAMQDESYMATQIDIIKSDDVARYVIDTTRLMDRPEARAVVAKAAKPFCAVASCAHWFQTFKWSQSAPAECWTCSSLRRMRPLPVMA